MQRHFSRRSLIQGGAVGLTALGVTGCIPTLGQNRAGKINVGLITYEQGFQPSALILYKAALAVTKAHPGDLDLNVLQITVIPPTPGSGPVMPISGRGPELPTISALEKALDQDPPPDVVFFDSSLEFGMALEKNLIQPLDTYARNDSTLKTEDFFSGALRAVSDQGQLYALPLSVQPTVLAYDKRLFDAEHLDPPSGSWNWTTFLNAAKALTKPGDAGAGQIGVNLFFSGPTANTITSFIWQNGGEVVSPDGRRSLLNEPPAQEAIKFLYDLAHTFKVVALPPTENSGRGGKFGVAYAKGQSEHPGFGTPDGQRAAMQYEQLGGYGRFGFFGGPGGESPIRLAEPPRGKNPATTMDLIGMFAMTQRTTDPRAAYRVMALLAQEMAKEMSIPAHRPTAQQLTKFNPSITEDEAKVLVASLEYARALPPLVQARALDALYSDLVAPLQQGDKTPPEIAKDAAEAMDLALNGEAPPAGGRG